MSTCSQSSEEEEEEEEESPLEYARRNGLACDHLAERIPLPYSITPDGTESGTTDDMHLYQFEFPDYSTDERPPLSRDAAMLLAYVSTPEKEESVDSAALPLLGSGRLKHRLLELPLLKSDHDIDCKQFARREGFEIKLADIKLPLEMVDEEKDEGLMFPTKLWDAEAHIMEELMKEKLSATKETLTYLSGALKTEWNQDIEDEVWASVDTYKKNHVTAPVTPPLSPLPQPIQPFEFSSSDPAFQLPILSDPVSLTKRDLDVIEKKLFEQDTPTPIRVHMANRDETSSDTYSRDGDKLGNIYSPLASLEDMSTPPFIQSERVKRDSLKVEEMLTPLNTASIPKSVHFSSVIKEMVFKSPSPSILEPFEDTFFETAFGDAAERAMRLAEQETLIAADTTARVEVPVLGFSVADPPWKMFQNQGEPAKLLTMQKALIRKSVGQNLPKWPDSRRVEIQLKWNPFPHRLAKVAPEDDFEMNDDHWKVIVNGPKDEIDFDISSLTWKAPGLRILKADDDDDEIEPGKFLSNQSSELSYLVKKRKMEIEDREAAAKPAASMPNNSLINHFADEAASKSRDFITAAQKLQEQQQNGEDTGFLGAAFSIANALDNYMEIRNTKKPKLEGSSFFPNAPANPGATTPRPTSSMQLPIRKSPITMDRPMPTPSTQSPATPPSIIFSYLVLKNRALIKQLECQLPGLKIIERDFTAHNTTAWLPNSVTRSPVTSSLAAEADINISPLTGIILTTLQKIKQKPLPGQKTKPAIRDRLETVALRYERLIVLIGEGEHVETANGLEESGCLALSEFIGFTIGLNANFIVHFVGGGEEIFSKWLVSTIIQYGNIRVCDLLDDETHWELFLRRAGMNAFAAQAIIADLKAPDGVNTQSPSKVGHFGLVAFVEMGLEQRLARFGRLCGRKLIERVSAVIDARWE